MKQIRTFHTQPMSLMKVNFLKAKFLTKVTYITDSRIWIHKVVDQDKINIHNKTQTKRFNRSYCSHNWIQCCSFHYCRQGVPNKVFLAFHYVLFDISLCYLVLICASKSTNIWQRLKIKQHELSIVRSRVCSNTILWELSNIVPVSPWVNWRITHKSATYIEDNTIAETGLKGKPERSTTDYVIH